MILTNKLGLPRSIENAVRRDPYSRGNAHISVTALIDSARKRALEIKHQDTITEDVADRVFALMGQVLHGVLERADDEAITEKRLFIERHGWVISGSFDRLLLEGQTLQDYKSTSTYALKNGPKPGWVAQMNVYALMIREDMGATVDRSQIVVIYRDFQKSKAKHAPDSYPQSPVGVFDVPLWTAAQTEAYITERLMAHGHAQHELPECTAEERWARPPVYALWKEGNMKATKLFQNKDEAGRAIIDAQMKSAKMQYRIEAMPEQNVRCDDYCSAADYCEQYKKLSTNSLGLRKSG